MDKIPAIIYKSYEHLFIVQPFKGFGLTLLLILIFIFGLVVILKKGFFKLKSRPLYFIVYIFLLFILPVAAKSQFFISSSTAYFDNRFAALGLNYIYLFFMLTLLFSGIQLVRNIAFMLFFPLLCALMINCLNYQVFHSRMVFHDLSVLNRILQRLEQLPNFEPEKTYNLVQLGRTRPYVASNYKDYYSTAAGPTIFNMSISQAWNPGYELRLISSYLNLGTRINEYDTRHKELLAQAISFAENKKPFPAKDSIGIINNTIVFFLDSRALDIAKNTLKNKKIKQ